MKRKAHETTNDSVEDSINKLVSLFDQGRYAEVEALARDLTKRFPQNGAGWRVLGVILALQGRKAEALEPMRKAAELLPGDAEAHSNLGNVLQGLGRLAEAEASYRRALILNPDLGDVHNNLGVTLKEQGRLAEAETSYRQAISIKPDLAQAHSNLAVTLKDQGRLAEAETSYRRAISIKPDYAEAHSNLGNALRDQGRLVEAEASYRRALIFKPDYAEAHSNLGNALRDLGRLVDAEASYRQALAIKPDFAEAHNNLGNALRDLGRLAEGEASYRRALVIKPGYPEAHNNLGVALRDQGRLTDAEASYRRAISIKPDYAEAHSNLGVVLYDQGRPTEAEASCRQALILKPNYAEAHNNLGNALRDLGRPSEAEASYRQALIIKPDYAEAHYNLGNALRDLGRPGEAEASLRRALILKPDFAEAYSNLGVVLRDQGRLAEGEASLRQALSIRPDYAEGHSNLGNTLQEQGKLTEAEASYRRALSTKPDLAEAHSNLGVTLRDQGRLAEGEASLRQALSIRPDYAEAHGNLGVVLRDLGRLAEAEASCRQALILKPDYAEAHSNLLFTMSYTPGRHVSDYLEEASRYGQMVAKKVEACIEAWQCARRPERLRVGFVSGDLHNHPVGYFLESILAQLDLSRMELIAYATGPKEDELTVRIKPYFSAWKSLMALSDKAAAGLIHSDGIHVLLDCSGHTGRNRLPLFAWKPAPVQASWPGYFASTGVAEMDYLLGDPYVTPIGEEGHFTETVWRLPETYLCFTPPNIPLEVGPLPALASGSITFGSFNNLVKMNDRVVTLWAKVLKAVPRARLFLKAKQLNDPGVRDATRQRFGAHGITPDRLLLEGHSPRATMLEAYNRVDIILSPFPYPGGTTSAEGLWMGVPAITRRGDCFLAHIGESIAHNAGLADWIAEDDDDYVAKAILHTADPGRLAALRHGLRAQMLASPLFDAPRFARHLEAALWGMWEQWQGRGIGSEDRSARTFSPRRTGHVIQERTEKIEIVSASRCNAEEFKQTPLARSIERLKYDPRVTSHVTFSNSAGLPEIYNRRIHESANDILLFVHDDVWIDDYFLADRVIDGLGLYQVIGVAGNTRLIDSHVAWHLKEGQWDFPHLSGAVAHGAAPFGMVSHYGGTPRTCELLDGVLLAARRSVLREKGLSFDTRFSFHFYDLDFCRTVRQSGLSLGTWPIAITHKSGGTFGSAQWTQALIVYKAKWPEASTAQDENERPIP